MILQRGDTRLPARHIHAGFSWLHGRGRRRAVRRLPIVRRQRSFCRPGLDHDQANVDWATCMGCGVCVAHCPQEAISLLHDQARGEPLEIQKLIAQAGPTGIRKKLVRAEERRDDTRSTNCPF